MRRRALTALLLGVILGGARTSAAQDAEPAAGSPTTSETTAAAAAATSTAATAAATSSSTFGVTPETALAKSEAARAEVFAAQSFTFCHDEGFGRAGTLGVDFCAILDPSTEDVCPHAHESCPAWRWPPELDAEARRRRALEAFVPGASDFELPSVPKGVAQILLGLGVAVLALLLLRAFGRFERRPGRPGVEDIPESLEQLTELPETEAQVILREARAALERGDSRRALELVHLALLRFLDDRGWVRFHPSYTNGEYLRMLRPHPEVKEGFQGVVLQVERLRFGDGEVDPEATGRSLSEAEAMVRRPRGGPPVAALTVLLALACPQPGCLPRPDDAAYFFRGPTGLAALPELLREVGIEAELTAEAVEDVEPKGVVVLRTAALDEADLEPFGGALGRLLDGGADVVILDDGWTASAAFPTTSITATSTGAAIALERARGAGEDPCVEALVPALARLDAGDVVVPRARALVSGSNRDLDFEPLLLDASGRSVALFAHRTYDSGEVYEGGRLYVFADRDLFTNASLTRPGNAAFAAAFFAALVGPMETLRFVDRPEAYGSGAGGSGDGTPDAEHMLRASKILPFLLQLFVLLLALAAWRGAAFGRLRDLRPARSRSFAEHADAIGILYEKTGAAGRRHVARSLARWVLHVHRGRLGGRSRDAFARELAAERGADPEQAARALALAHAAGDDDEAPPDELLETLSRLAAAPRAPGGGRSRKS